MSYQARMDFFPGDMIGNYRLKELIGQGGFADVWRAEQEILRREVAIKILHMHIDADQSRRKYLDEAQYLANLHHPNIVEIIDVGFTHNDIPYLVLAYASKGTLRKRHPKGTRVPLATVVAYVRQIADGLQMAHNKRLVHRDIKPDNILIGPDGILWVSDFGIAKVIETMQNTQQEPSRIVGTIAYMAPEQFDGKVVAVIDQYALAVMVYEWLCGELPFDSNVVEKIMSLPKRPVPLLRPKLPDLPLEVEDIIIEALSFHYKDRFNSIKEFADNLEAAYQKSLRPVPIVNAIHRAEAIDAPSIVTHRRISEAPIDDHMYHGVSSTPPLSPEPPPEPAPAPKWYEGPVISYPTVNKAITEEVLQAPLGAFEHQMSAPPRARPKIRKKWFDSKLLKKTKNIIFLVWGVPLDILFVVPLGLWIHNWNAVIILLWVILIIRSFCAMATYRKIAIPLAWCLIAYWCLTGFVFFELIHMTIYAFLVPIAVIAFLLHDLTYARQKVK